MIHTIFFDIGGTLVDSDNIFKRTASAMGCSGNKEVVDFLNMKFNDIYSDVGNGRMEFMSVPEMLQLAISKTSEKFGLEDAGIDAGAIYADTFLNTSRLFEDVMPALTKLKEMGLKLIAMSDAEKGIMDKELDKFGIRHLFDNVLISSEIKSYKPSGRTAQFCLNVCKKPYSDIFFVGDSKADVLISERMGVKSVFIDRKRMHSGIRCDFLIHNLNELVELVN